MLSDRPESWSRVSIVGLGVIGGSMASALRARLPQLHLTGVDREEVVAAGDARALVDVCVSEQDATGVERAFAASDLIFLAAPVSAIRRWLDAALSHAALVTDCGSTKRELAAAARALPGAARFVPGHPMAGAGASRAAASAQLFDGRPWVLCPEGAEPAALETVERLVRLIGGRPVRMSAVEHDRAVALTSHAPRLVSSALAVLVERAGAFDAAGPAFERLLRGAGGSPEMWRDVLQSNADEVARALRQLLVELSHCADELERAGVQRCLDTLAAAEAARAAFEGRPLPER
jgi:prephenate dehydrogenase